MVLYDGIYCTLSNFLNLLWIIYNVSTFILGCNSIVLFCVLYDGAHRRFHSEPT